MQRGALPPLQNNIEREGGPSVGEATLCNEKAVEHRRVVLGH